MKIIRLICRIIVGLVFIFSGTVKAIDPMGSAYKFQDYFQAFNLGFLSSLSLFLGIALCTAEFIAGFSVLTGYRIKTGIWVTMLMMIIFTPLTFILALYNPVSDCGCFGEAIHLTNWQTFIKNIIILIPVLILFSGRNKTGTGGIIHREWMVITITILFFLLFICYNLRYLPVIDFLPYKTGIHIPEKMVIPADKPADQYETTFIYEKEGIRKEFTLENYPADDSTWLFIDQKSVLVKKGYVPPIHDFSITTTENEDITDMVLSNGGFSMIMISKKLEEADEDKLGDGFELGRFCMENGINFYILTASGSDKVKEYSNGLQFCFTDETTLKTIVRSNPGYMLLSQGTIAGKWSWAGIPDNETILDIVEKYQK